VTDGDDREGAGAGGDIATVQRPRIDPADASQTAYVLSAIEGPDAGKSFTVDAAQPQRVLVGQSEACQVRLSDRQVSRRHAALELQQLRLRLTDLGSTNGTFVDGVAMLDGYLRGGEIVRMGETAFRIDRGLSPSPARLSQASGFGRVVGSSPAMRRLYPLCERLAATMVPVIIEGETGTGKELLAEALHETGPRATGPFVVFDCTAVPPNLVESELFGHERGAFTGAVGARRGVFEQAHGGTLLIDEIGDLDAALQPKLLRCIERSEVRRVGSERSIAVDVRVLAATRRDLDAEVQAGRFRDDLFHRLAVARIELPPLRRRPGDVAVLVRHFWAQLGGNPAELGADALTRFEAYGWPGNIRELRNTVSRRIALGDLALSFGSRADTDDAPSVPPPPAPPSALAAPDPFEAVLARELPFSAARQALLAEFEQRYVQRVLTRHGGNVSQAAAASGLARRYFQILRAKRR
jgi:DNA-binding NtrC family response regulator